MSTSAHDRNLAALAAALNKDLLPSDPTEAGDEGGEDCGGLVREPWGMCGSSRRQVLLAGAAVPLLARLPRALPAVALAGVAVQPRAAWGADLLPKGPLPEEAAGDVRFLLVHHTASANGYAQAEVPGLLRGFYGFHTGAAKGWPDIAYSFLVDRFGQVWEGRTGSLDGPVKVDATGGSQGFAQLGCFIGDHTSEPPTPAALDAMGRLLGALARRYGIDVRPGTTATFVSRGSNLHPAGTQVTTPTIAGHRDMSRTSCPGDACFPLIPSRLIPAAVTAAGLAPTAAAPTTKASPPSTVAPRPERPAPSSTAPSSTAPSSTAPSSTAPPDTVANEPAPAAEPGGPTPDAAPAPATVPPPLELAGGVVPPSRRGNLVGAGVAVGAVTAAGALLAVVLRRRGRGREGDLGDGAARLQVVQAGSESQDRPGPGSG